jgi:hypothetical protein
MSTDDKGLKRLFDLVDLADPDKSPNENEARNAAMKVCEFLREHRGRIALADSGRGNGQTHPLTAIFQRWRVNPTKAAEAMWCLSCGEAIERGESAATQYQVGSTHYNCREWWSGFDFSGLPAGSDDDIPF